MYDFSRDFMNLGILPGDTVLMHSSMKSLGTDVTPEYFLKALSEYLGEKGTLLLPTLTYSNVGEHQPLFSVKETVPCIGLLPRVFAQMDGVIRSMHPTHSCAALGYRAKEMTSRHHLDKTPVGENSPFRILADVGGKILMVGDINDHCTFMHGMEEIAGAPYCLNKHTTRYILEDYDGTRREVHLYGHDFKDIAEQKYSRFENILSYPDIRKGRICKADCTLISASALKEASLEAFKTDPFYFVVKKRKESKFETAFRFIVTSDNHISAVTDTSAKRLEQLFKSAYDYAQKQEYKKTDAFVSVGDMTNHGYPYEYEAWKSIVNKNKKDETTVITVMGNHEFYGDLKDLDKGERLYAENMDAELNKHVVVGGYHFIGVSTYGEGDYSADIGWLEEQLAAAKEDAPEKPIITFQHHHIKDTVYVSAEWYSVHSKMLDNAYSKYPQVINFSGHSHGPINNPTSCFQTEYTLFGTGTLAYFEMTTGMTYGTIPPNAGNAAQFYIVEISKDNRVRVLPYNLLTDDFFKTADGKQQLVYEIDDLFDKTSWKYTSARSEASTAPAFGKDAGITFGKITDTTAEITFPQAWDKDCVYSYNIVCISDAGKKEYNYFSEYYFEPMPKTLSFTLSELVSDTQYKTEVYPINAFGKKGECIAACFKTEK